MIYKLVVEKEENKITWEWYWRKSFKLFSFWQWSPGSFNFTSCETFLSVFTVDLFKCFSRIAVEDKHLEIIYRGVLKKLNDFTYIEILIHVAKDGTVFYL